MNDEAISFNSVIDNINQLNKDGGFTDYAAYCCLYDAILYLPPVTPSRPNGHFIYEPRQRLINETDDGCEYITDYWCKCSECGGNFGFIKMDDAFCKFCGAKMVGDEHGR